MTNEQKREAILELAKGLASKELRDLGYEFDDLGDETAKQECKANGHQIDDDQCGKPAHRYCGHCFERETAILARQAKVDEASDSKSETPSESLGSGSN